LEESLVRKIDRICRSFAMRNLILREFCTTKIFGRVFHFEGAINRLPIAQVR
jgi:hypothetical protein